MEEADEHVEQEDEEQVEQEDEEEEDEEEDLFRWGEEAGGGVTAGRPEDEGLSGVETAGGGTAFGGGWIDGAFSAGRKSERGERGGSRGGVISCRGARGRLGGSPGRVSPVFPGLGGTPLFSVGSGRGPRLSAPSRDARSHADICGSICRRLSRKVSAGSSGLTLP